MVRRVPARTIVRPMTAGDVDAIHALQIAAFEDLDRRLGETPYPPPDIAHSRVRLGRILGTDPGGCWVAEHDGGLAGCALAILRDGLWGLSLLAVRPDVQ